MKTFAKVELGEQAYARYIKNNPCNYKRIIVAWVVSLLCLFSALYFYFITEPVTVNFVDVGQGDACLIKGDKNGDVLIDGGDSGSGNILLNYLYLNSVYSLDSVFITHFHADHATGIMELLDMGYPIKQLYVPDMKSGTEIEEKFFEKIREKSIPVTRVKLGDEFEIGCMKYEVLWPGDDRQNLDLNNASMVLKVAYGENTFLMTGDIEVRAELLMEEEVGDSLDADVIKVPHHGSNSSSSTTLLKATTPKYAVFTVGYGNSYGNPAKKIVNRVEESTEGIWRTDLHGTVSFTLDEEKIKNVRYSSKFR